jgi:ribosomal protein S27AE
MTRKRQKAKKRASDQGWYAGIPVVDNRATCTRCGTRTALLDHDHSECLRCVLERRKAARDA